MGIEIVIVDDAPFIREALRNSLESLGMTVVGEASRGPEAIELLKSLQPDAVIVDMVMPEMNGIELTEKIKAQYPNLKIIACSTESQNDMLVKALDAGCCEFISKPFTKESLGAKIKLALDN